MMALGCEDLKDEVKYYHKFILITNYESILREEKTRTVQVKGAPVPVKTVTLKVEKDIKTSLWRDLSSQSLMVQYVTMTNVVVNLSRTKFLYQPQLGQKLRYIKCLLKYNHKLD